MRSFSAGGPIEGTVEGEVQDGGLQAQGLFAQTKHKVDVLVHRGRLDHAVAALVLGNGLRITVAALAPRNWPMSEAARLRKASRSRS